MRRRIGRRPCSWSFMWQAEPPRASLGQGASETRVGGGGAPPMVLRPPGTSKATRQCLSAMAAAGGWGVGWRSSSWHNNGGGEARRKNSWSPARESASDVHPEGLDCPGIKELNMEEAAMTEFACLYQYNDQEVASLCAHLEEATPRAPCLYTLKTYMWQMVIVGRARGGSVHRVLCLSFQ